MEGEDQPDEVMSAGKARLNASNAATSPAFNPTAACAATSVKIKYKALVTTNADLILSNDGHYLWTEYKQQSRQQGEKEPNTKPRRLAYFAANPPTLKHDRYHNVPL